ncbi:hypothetical protein ACROYT_G020370 [Oculina patagonica]
MERRLLVPLVVGLLLVVISVADPQAQYQLRRPLQMNAQTRTLPQNRFIGPKDPQVQYQLRPPLQMNAQTRTLPQNRFIGPKGVQTQYQFPRPVQMNAQSRNFLPNRFSAKKAGHYPPVPPGTGGQLPGDSRNFIPNRFDIPASVIDKKPGTSVGCVGADPCGLVAPYSPPALPIPPPPPAYTGFPPPQVPYGPQGYVQQPPMTPDGYGFYCPCPFASGTDSICPSAAVTLGTSAAGCTSAINNNAPQVPFPPEMSQAPSFNDPGQQVTPEGSFDLAKKRMMAMQAKGQLKRFGESRSNIQSLVIKLGNCLTKRCKHASKPQKDCTASGGCWRKETTDG